MKESVVLPAREAIHSYVAHVAHHLSDLPAEEREELIGGLEADLAERATELPDGADLTSAFGAPEEYAAELRSAAGLPPRVVTAPPAPPKVSVLAENEASWRASRDAFLAKHSWAADLRPVWWVARGAILALVPLFLLGVPLFGLGFWFLTIAGAAVSFWWSRRDPAPSTWANRIAILASLAALLISLPLALTMAARAAWTGEPQVIYSESVGSGGTMGSDGVWVNGEPASNLYVYDAEGNRLDRVRIFNQYGQAVGVPHEGLEHANTDLINRTGQEVPRKPDGDFDVNRFVFPMTWGTLTGWETSNGGWEPPVKISTLPGTSTGTPGASSPSATPAPGSTPTSPAASPTPSEPAADASPSPSATP